MNTPAPDHEEHDPLSAALRRDAARVQEPPFDPALHYAILRRIRAMADTGAAPSRLRWMPALVTTAAVLVLAVLLAFWLPRSSPRNVPRETARTAPIHTAPIKTAPPTSLLAYQAAAAEGDDALLAMLDRDAQRLLPPSAPIFNAPLR